MIHKQKLWVQGYNKALFMNSKTCIMYEAFENIVFMLVNNTFMGDFSLNNDAKWQ